MKKLFSLIATVVLISIPLASQALERTVTSEQDIPSGGTLRYLLQSACDQAGNDTINFAIINSPETRIELGSPLVIPADCQGTITIEGSLDIDVVLDGSAIANTGTQPFEDCILHIYTDNNRVTKLSFVNNVSGGGVCVFGQNNTIENNRIGLTLRNSIEPNANGVVITNYHAGTYPDMDGANNTVTGNEIQYNDDKGVWVQANAATIQDNDISYNGTDGIWITSADTIIRHNDIKENGRCLSDYSIYDSTYCSGTYEGLGLGILVAEGSSQITIGGTDSYADKNTIQNNANGGVFVLGDSSSGIQITHNLIFDNDGSGYGIDLGGDGLTPNDEADLDTGANTLLNSIDFMQAFPLADGNRYWLFGVAQDKTRVELYSVSENDSNAGQTYGGAETFFNDKNIVNKTFEVQPSSYAFETGNVITSLSFDSAGNTSEYSANIYFGADYDLDGIPDEVEIGDGSEETASSSATNRDSDGDGLPDAVEDKNRNGSWDIELYETSAFNLDSDGDGVSDWHETHGDGLYLAGKDTNPLGADSDLDGLNDGDEDTNGNGIWEAYLSETSPNLSDSDGDGYSDRFDTCPAIYNPGQKEWYCDGTGFPFRDFHRGNLWRMGESRDQTNTQSKDNNPKMVKVPTS